MKQYLKVVTILFLIIGCNSIDKNENNRFLLEGITNEINDGTVIQLLDVLSNRIIDSTEVKNKKFSFSGNLKIVPLQVFIQTKDRLEFREVWLENKQMVFDASNTDFMNSKVSGSETQKLADLHFNEVKSIQDFDKMHKFTKKFIKDYPESIVSASFLSIFSTAWGKSEVIELYKLFPDENKNNAYSKKIEDYIQLNKNLQIGDRYVDFEMNNKSGDKVKLSENLGKLTLLEFWASWCGPCRAENPNLVNTYSDFNPKGFEIFSVSLDDNSENWKKAIKEDKLIWTHVSDLEGQSNKAGLIYGIKGIPDNFLLDETGKIIGRNLRGESLNKKLKEYLK